MVFQFFSRWDTWSTGTNKASHVVDAHAAEVGGATSRVCVCLCVTAVFHVHRSIV